jgi:hypothetical protein
MSLLALGARKVSPVFATALVFRGTGFFERDGDRLLPTLHFAALPARTAFELAVLELMHDAARGLALSR